MQNQGQKRNLKHSVIKAANYLFDVVFPVIRLLFFPFYWSTRVFTLLSSGLWLLSNEYVKRKLKRCGVGVRLRGKLYISAPHCVEIGNNVHINDNAFIRAEGGLVIGDNTHISRNLVIYTMNHNYEGDFLPYDDKKILKPVIIGRNVWIGMNVMIIPGATINDGAIVGMGAIVSGDVPPLAVVGSAPMRELKFRNKEHYSRVESQARFSGTSGFPNTKIK